jgi:hypothetical protein
VTITINPTKDAGNRTLTPQALAARWNISTGHLANLRSQGTGPAYIKPVGRVLYRLTDVLRWENRTLVSPGGAR